MKTSFLFCVVLVITQVIGGKTANFLSNVLGDNMVLQRSPHRALLWGWTSKEGVTVKASFNNKNYNAVSDSSSKWEIALDPTEAGGPYDISLVSSDGNSTVIKNVLFGDVWICSGQSNMQMTVSDVFNATAEIAEANNYPNIRVMTVGQNTISLTPLNELATIEQQWSVASSTSIGGKSWKYFSATCWFFGRDLYNSLGGKVPLGLVSTNWGGTYVQAWSSPDALKQCNQTSIKSAPKDGPNQPSVLWNAMVVPFLNMRVRGSTWYQGEANVGHADYYACAFPAMIKDWRNKFNLEAENFGFFFVQLAPYTNAGVALAELRYAQTAALDLPFVGMATAIDLGDWDNPPDGVIHPRYKQAVGQRLALATDAIIYGQKVQYLGPTFHTAHVRSQNPAVYDVEFTAESIGAGLVLHEASCPTVVGDNNCAWAQVAGSDGNWYNATQSINGNYFRLSASLKSGVRPVGVRYLWNEWPVATLYNKEGLPATPFYYSQQ